MIRLHASHSKRFKGVIKTKQAYRRQLVSDKPAGFWWSVGTAWMEWCEGAEWNIGGRVFSLDVVEDKLLNISTYAEFDAFKKKFEGALYGDEPRYIDWAAVAAQWDGIEIAPYLWRRRLSFDSIWYYGWDCACGVTWRPSKVIRSAEYIGDWTHGNIPGAHLDPTHVSK